MTLITGKTGCIKEKVSAATVRATCSKTTANTSAKSTAAEKKQLDSQQQHMMNRSNIGNKRIEKTILHITAAKLMAHTANNMKIKSVQLKRVMGLTTMPFYCPYLHKVITQTCSFTGVTVHASCKRSTRSEQH